MSSSAAAGTTAAAEAADAIASKDYQSPSTWPYGPRARDDAATWELKCTDPEKIKYGPLGIALNLRL